MLHPPHSQAQQQHRERMPSLHCPMLIVVFTKPTCFPFQWGERLHSEQEDFLVAQNNHVPVFVTHFPAAAMPFYARPSDSNPEIVSQASFMPS